MSKQTYPCEVLSFHNGDHLATIATNGFRHISQDIEMIVKEHASLSKAIAYLEVKGYRIDTDNFRSI